MKKLTLNLDELAVETFAPAAADPEPGGTVRGNQLTPLPSCLASCLASCNGSCRANPAGDWLRIDRTFTNCPQCCV